MGGFDEYHWLAKDAKRWWRLDGEDEEPAENARSMRAIFGQAGVFGTPYPPAANDRRNDLFSMVLIIRRDLHLELCQKLCKFRYNKAGNLQINARAKFRASKPKPAK